MWGALFKFSAAKHTKVILKLQHMSRRVDFTREIIKAKFFLSIKKGFRLIRRRRINISLGSNLEPFLGSVQCSIRIPIQPVQMVEDI